MQRQSDKVNSVIQSPARVVMFCFFAKCIRVARTCICERTYMLDVRTPHNLRPDASALICGTSSLHRKSMLLCAPMVYKPFEFITLRSLTSRRTLCLVNLILLESLAVFGNLYAQNRRCAIILHCQVYAVYIVSYDCEYVSRACCVFVNRH